MNGVVPDLIANKARMYDSHENGNASTRYQLNLPPSCPPT